MNLFFLCLLSCIDDLPELAFGRFPENPFEDFDLDGFSENEGDCDDLEPDRFPGNTELCDGLDNDCDGEVDNDAQDARRFYADVDADGFGVEAHYVYACEEELIGHVGTRDDGLFDCDDMLVGVHPGNLFQESDFGCYLDADSDGWGDMATGTQYDSGSDCDDAEPAVYPGNARLEPDLSGCFIDLDRDGWGDLHQSAPFTAGSDCDDDNDFVYPGSSSEPDQGLCVLDSDGAGWGSAEVEQLSGYDPGTDCDDANAGTYPGSAIFEDSAACVLDTDGDGYGDSGAQAPYAPGSDCADGDASVSPGAVELCDGLDNDCDGDADSDSVDAPVWYGDSDGDGYGNASFDTRACSQPESYSGVSTDCDDGAAAVFPGALEYCNGVDDDCDGESDEGQDAEAPVDAPDWYLDADGDGYGLELVSVKSCSVPDGYVAEGGDCNDGSTAHHPGADETCNAADDDCDGIVDEEGSLGAATYYLDADGDGFGDADSPIQACSAPLDYVEDSRDCNDLLPAVNPDADETCNGLDDDCNGSADGDDSIDRFTYYADADLDGYGDPAGVALSCSLPDGHVLNSGDCDDSSAEISPEAEESCDGADNDCDG
jgi:large repetitive protein